MTKTTSTQASLSLKQVFQTWWPLAAGWLMMTAEIPLITAIVARNPDPKIHLAAWGVAFPIVLIMASPAMMLLAASTTLSKDWESFLRLRRFTLVVVAILTGVFILIGFTPLFDLLVTDIMGVPDVVVEPARLGFRVMLPWLAFLGYRRFNYGVLIRNDRSRAITVGVITRLCADVLVLGLFSWIDDLPGIVFAAGTMTVGVVTEGIYSGIRVRAVLPEVKTAPPVVEILTLPVILNFYVPLMLTSLMHVLMQPILSAALSRMPNPLDSLAVWPIIFSFLILFTSAGMAYPEVVVVSLDESQALQSLRRFSYILSGISMGLLLLMTATPLAALWFEHVAALPAELIPLAKWGMWLVLPIPGFRVLQGWYQGLLMHHKQTRFITESVAVFLLVLGGLLVLGVNFGAGAGLYIGLSAYCTGDLMRVVWLWFRAKPAVQAVAEREDKRRLVYEPAQV